MTDYRDTHILRGMRRQACQPAASVALVAADYAIVRSHNALAVLLLLLTCSKTK